MSRVKIAEFGIIQKLLALATVTILVADGDGENTGVKATIYQASTGSDIQENPQTLDENGMLLQDCWVDTQVLATITGITDRAERSIKKIKQNPMDYALPITTAAAYANNAMTYAAALSGTSLTSLTIGIGAKVFATQSGKQWALGQRLRAASDDGLLVIEGPVTAYADGSLTITADYTKGSGVNADWNISIAGVPGSASSGVTDGDYGDIVVTMTGAAWAFKSSVVTAFARTFLDDADASAVRTTLGLVIGTNVQAQDAELSAIAGLTSAADKGIYFTGSGTASLYDLTSYARTLLDDSNAAGARTTLGVAIGTDVQAQSARLQDISDNLSATTGTVEKTAANTFGTYTVTTFAKTFLDDTDAATVRTTLGLVIGTNIQAQDAELSAIAGLTSAANKGIMFSGSGTAATYDLTTFALTILDDADASTVRTTLGLVIGTNVQAQDAELSAIAGLTSAADRVPYFTGSATAALLVLDTDGTLAANSDTTLATQKAVKTYVSAAVAAGVSDGDKGDIVVSSSGTIWNFDTNVVTTFAKTFLDDAAATNVRTTLGLAIGTDVQAQDTELSAFAGLTSAADTIGYFNGSGTMTTTAFTSTARSLLDDTSTSAMRTTLGLAIGTDVQAQDAELSAIAGLTSAADSLPYFTGSGTASLTTLTTFGRSLIDDSAASNARTTLGLVIGTDVQAQDAELAAIAGLTSAANKGITFTGSGTASTYDLSAFALTLLDDTSAAAARTTIGAAALAVTQTFSGAQIAAVTALTSTSNSTAVDLSLNNNFSHTFTENTTLANPTNATAGQSGQIAFTQHASAAKTLAFGSNWKEAASGSAPSVSTTTGAINLLSYYVVDSTHIWYVMNKGGVT